MEKLEPGTKVKILYNKTGHGLTIGNTYTIKNILRYDKTIGYIYMVIEDDFGWSVSSNEIEVLEPTFKVGYLVTIGDCKTVYKIESISNNIATIFHLKNRNRYDYHIDRLKLYTGEKSVNTTSLESSITGMGLRTDTGCIDYAVSYLDTSTVTVDKQGTIKNTLSNNYNTMQKLNQLRADKFFANEKNLTAIETLDTLLKDSIDLVVATKEELDRVQSKLIGLNKKLESATNNQDVAMLKDLIASTKVVQEFVDELKGKTISKFETAKTKFDVAGYLKD